ncbi:oligosaccharide flippase family protein [Parabacteroides sp.]|uniref:oligosaccharide flippase family protein n=1 Tax=Parabacteroides sp. TaxID=1869337 RepID=UPI00257D016F|nr:oligosaccharide flippase family protein [Parabacteroides sp.]
MLHKVIEKYKEKPFLKDSFWAVFGNGMGYFLLLMAGIAIARLLGKDVYGEYGMVKTTMFHIAAFSSFGLSYTSTKFIAEYKSRDNTYLKSIVLASVNITLISSLSLSVLMFCYADLLASFIHAPQLMVAFRYLSIITVLRALSTVGAGLLAGFKSFKSLGVNNIISGLIMLVLTIPSTYFYGLQGSLFSLCISQFILAFLNILRVYHIVVALKNQTRQRFYKRLFTFSIPVELQEFSYAICNWGASLLITRYASLGELGIYSACSQWYAIVLFLPSLLHNVVLSYLSGAVGSNTENTNMFKKMLKINFICALIPFAIVALASSLIASFYGQTFAGMQSTLIILILATILATLSNVYVANLLANSRNWILSILRVSRDILSIVSLYFILILTNGEDAASNYAVLNVIVSVLFLVIVLLFSNKNK